MALLFVIPPLPPASASDAYGWALWSADGRQVREHGSAVPALLPSADEVLLGVPAAVLSWHQVTLPQGSLGGNVRVRALLNGLLEDRLLDDPEQLHFALAPGAQAGAPAWVAACNRAWLRAAVQAIESTGRRVMRIVPEWAPLPVGAPSMVFATGDDDKALVTVCDASGVVTLPLDAASMAVVGTLPEDTTLQTEPAVAERAEQLFEQRIPILTTEARWMQASQSPWDLAQGDLASNGRARAGKKFNAVMQTLRHAPQWRAARWGAVLLIAAQLVGVNAWAWKERNALEAKRGAVRSMLTQTFPAVQLVVDAPVQMSREVALLQVATGGVTASDVEPMLAALGTSLPPGRMPTAIDYSGGQLRVRGLGLPASDAERLSSTLSTLGYSARSEGDLLLVQAESPR